MQKITFHKFNLGDVDDVEVYAAQPIYEWLQTEAGQWVQARCEDLTWHTAVDNTSFGYTVFLRGSIRDKHATEYYLKWPSS